MSMKGSARLLLPLLAMLLSACSTLQPPPAVTGPLRGTLPQDWSLRGKIGIRQQQHSDSAALDWQQQGKQYDIRLSGPLGQGGVHIQGAPGQVSMQVSGEDQTATAATPEALMQARLGWSLPLSEANYWVQGRPAPDYPSTPLNNRRGFHQLGWDVEIIRLSRTTLAGQDLVLPSLLRMRYGELTITLAIAQWSTHPQ